MSMDVVDVASPTSMCGMEIWVWMGGLMPLLTRPQRYCDPASLVNRSFFFLPHLSSYILIYSSVVCLSFNPLHLLSLLLICTPFLLIYPSPICLPFILSCHSIIYTWPYFSSVLHSCSSVLPICPSHLSFPFVQPVLSRRQLEKWDVARPATNLVIVGCFCQLLLLFISFSSSSFLFSSSSFLSPPLHFCFPLLHFFNLRFISFVIVLVFSFFLFLLFFFLLGSFLITLHNDLFFISFFSFSFFSFFLFLFFLFFFFSFSYPVLVAG